MAVVATGMVCWRGANPRSQRAARARPWCRFHPVARRTAMLGGLRRGVDRASEPLTERVAGPTDHGEIQRKCIFNTEKPRMRRGPIALRPNWHDGALVVAQRYAGVEWRSLRGPRGEAPYASTLECAAVDKGAEHVGVACCCYRPGTDLDAEIWRGLFAASSGRTDTRTRADSRPPVRHLGNMRESR